MRIFIVDIYFILRESVIIDSFMEYVYASFAEINLFFLDVTRLFIIVK